MYVRKVYKIDRRYMILKEDEQIPAKGERFSGYKTAKQALQGARDEAVDHGANARDVVITANEHADRDLIIKCGLTAA